MEAKKNILIIDDDPDYVEAIKLILEGDGYHVDFSNDTESGYKKLMDSTPHLLVLDIMMGKGAEGIIFARKMRKEEKLKELPVLMITSIREQTGFFFPGQAAHPFYLPVDELVEKPIDAKVLLQKVETLLGK
ncbi:MAG: response regulator [Candidatus Eremiobacteraeota bacterium]|nr:response regulator [Candidatus Eremiobacteraeota bacterium]